MNEKYLALILTLWFVGFGTALIQIKFYLREIVGLMKEDKNE